MYFEFGSPHKLDKLDKNPMNLQELKAKFQILLIDDHPPAILELLRKSGFNVRDFPDIQNIEAVEPFPIVACDIEGIGKAFRPDSKVGGIHVLREIRKYYPDKYLIQYSTKSQDIDPSLNKADIIFPKDTTIDVWQQTIEKALEELGNPKKRWMKVRRRLSDEGVDGHEIFRLEQAHIKDLLGATKDGLRSQSSTSNLQPALEKLIINFVVTTASMGIKEMLK